MPEAAMMRSDARVATALPSRYLEQLCKHFEHKLAVTREHGRGTIAFSAGLCELAAESDALVLHVAASDATALGMLEDVVARHLKRFAFREEPDVIWQRA
jgi:hypothetical protein